VLGGGDGEHGSSGGDEKGEEVGGLEELEAMTSHVTESLIMLIKLQLSPNARFNQVVKV
jgi:hypothetical protein